ncbi:MAG: patatin-like phospholipase family protein [Acidimicrobiia bacterium]
MRRVAVACQGGGSHTAFTAGVLGGLLTDDSLRDSQVVGISGTSGGAICALLAWASLLDDDRDGAAKRLVDFWADNAASTPFDRMLNAAMLAAGTAQGHGLLPAVSPYQLPTPQVGLDTFRAMLERHVDFTRVAATTPDRSGESPMLLLGAVEVNTGEFRAFNSHVDTIVPEHALASAAIPNLFPAVEVDGGAYWDGLFSQNPPVRDLLATRPDELWVIQVNPRERATTPTSLLDINDRRNELSGNLSLYQELGFIETIDALLERGELAPDGKYRPIVVRIIEMPRAALGSTWGPTSKLNRDPSFLDGLVVAGRAQAARFATTLAIEEAWKAGDADAVLAAFAPEAVTDELAAFVREHLGRDVTVDPVRKQLTGDTATWSVRIRSDAGTLEGAVEIGFRADGRAVSLTVHT